MAPSEATRASMTKFAILVLLVFAVMAYAIHSNRFQIYTSVCQRDYFKGKEATASPSMPSATPSSKTSPKKKTTTATPTKKPEVKLEFAKLFTVPPCDVKKNRSVPRDVCRNLAKTMDEVKYRQTYLRLLNYFDVMAKKHKWTYFMAFGTLLGSWRHHDVIPYDHDMDLFVEYKDRMDIVDKIDAQERFVPRQCTHHKIRLHDRDNVYGTQYAADVGRWYNPSIDMFFFVRNSTHIRRSDYPTWYISPLKEIFPLHRRPLGPLMLNSPRDTLKFLNTHYKATDVCSTVGNPKCKSYEPYLPFVHRKWKNGAMEESLILNKKVLQVKMIDEMEENLPLSPYTLASKRFPQV